jgi:cytoskeleton protein RodZ
MPGEQATTRTAGEILRAAREARGVSLADLSAITRIAEQQLVALERDEYDKISGTLYVRSFLRACAEALDAPVGEILERYDRQAGVERRGESPPDTWQEEVQVKRIDRSRAVLWLRAIGLIVLALAAVLILARVLLPGDSAPVR